MNPKQLDIFGQSIESIKTVNINGRTIFYRPNTKDRDVIKEVIENHCYRRMNPHFDVEPNEQWLDLGANIGTFAVYAESRGAICVCFEPDEDNFSLLQKNIQTSKAHRSTVTAIKDAQIQLYRNRGGAPTRYSTIGTIKHDTVPNVWSGDLCKYSVDGIKMDIEGSEGPIIDEWLLPSCKKLVLEYHTSRDPSVENLRKRIQTLKEHFKIVQYPPEFDRIISSNETEHKTFFDRLIFCINLL